MENLIYHLLGELNILSFRGGQLKTFNIPWIFVFFCLFIWFGLAIMPIIRKDLQIKKDEILSLINQTGYRNYTLLVTVSKMNSSITEGVINTYNKTVKKPTATIIKIVVVPLPRAHNKRTS